MSNYTAVVYGEAGGHAAWFPDLPGRAAMGESFEKPILDAMRDWAEVTKAKGGVLPPPRPIEVSKRAPDVESAIRKGAMSLSS